MLGIKKHVLKLRNSLVLLAEVIGLQKGLKAPKKSKRFWKGVKGLQDTSARARRFGAMCQIILIGKIMIK